MPASRFQKQSPKTSINKAYSKCSNANIVTDKNVNKLKQKSEQLTKTIFAKLSPMQIVQLSRHNKRPHTIDYINHLISDFDELHGDRYYSHGASIIGGIGRFENRPVMVMGHEKGRKTKDKLKHNFGMPSPEDYRKSQRLMKMAEIYDGCKMYGLSSKLLLKYTQTYFGIS